MMILRIVVFLFIRIQSVTCHGNLRQRLSSRMMEHERRRRSRSNSNGCIDVRDAFTLESQDFSSAMRCTDLGEYRYRFACTYPKVRHNCPRTCKSSCTDSFSRSSESESRNSRENHNHDNNDDFDDIIDRVDGADDDDMFNPERNNNNGDNDDDIFNEIRRSNDDRFDRGRFRDARIFDYEDDAFGGFN